LEFAGVQLDAGLVEGRLHLAAYALGLDASGVMLLDAARRVARRAAGRPALHLRRGADLPQQERRPCRRACLGRTRAGADAARLTSGKPDLRVNHNAGRDAPRRPGVEALSAASATVAFSARRILAPLALAQFICSFAGSNMNVMINDISDDLDTTVKGVQTTITLFLLIMAVLMIPCSKLTDRYGRKRCFMVGLALYGVGAVLSAVSPGLGVLILGNSVFEGVGTALLIPPVYILATLAFTDVTSRARAFGVISGAGGIGAAAGPLIGGVITTGISWRAAFIFQALIIVTIILLSRRLEDPLPPDPTRHFDTAGAILSAVGMFFVVFGILQAQTDAVLFVVFVAVGLALLIGFFFYIRGREREGKEALLSTDVFRNRTSNLGLATQNIQWLLLMGTSFVVAVFLQTVREFNAIKTGVIFTAATLGILVSSLAAERLAKRHEQRTLIRTGFVVTIAGIGLLIGFVGSSDNVWAFVPGLLVFGLGVGVMLTPSVNVVQSSFPEQKQGEISGLSRSVSNLGSSFGTAIAGTLLVSDLASGNRGYALAMAVLAVLSLIGLAAALLLPGQPRAVGRPAAEAA
jgi:MFS family permease